MEKMRCGEAPHAKTGHSSARTRSGAAIEEVGVEIPVVVRLEGNSADIGSKILSESGVKIESRNDLADAAKKAVELSR